MSDPSPITSDLSNYQNLQKQLFRFCTVNPPENFLLIKPTFLKGDVWESFTWKHSTYKVYNLCIAATVPLMYNLWQKSMHASNLYA